MIFSKTQNRCKLRLRLRLDLRPSVKLGQGQYCLSYWRLLFLWSNPNELTLIRYTEFINVYYKIGITTYLLRSQEIMTVVFCVFLLFLAGVSANITGQHVTTGECVCVTGTNVNARTSGTVQFFSYIIWWFLSKILR